MSMIVNAFFRVKRIFLHPQFEELLRNRKELLRRFLLYKDLCYGTFVGTDKFGNRYYQNLESPYGRNRFVLHYYQSMFYVEATNIDVEWFRWLHYTTDVPPKSYHLTGKPYLKPEGNTTGTKYAFYPYTTTPPKVVPWEGKRLLSDLSTELENTEGPKK